MHDRGNTPTNTSTARYYYSSDFLKCIIDSRKEGRHEPLNSNTSYTYNLCHGLLLLFTLAQMGITIIPDNP